jgi:hypothetical protein
MRAGREEVVAVVPKRERLTEFFRRLLAAPSAGTSDEVTQQLSNILDQVEDELTGVPNLPQNWREDGRMYPPQADHMRSVPGHPRVKRFRTAGHNIFVGENGSLQMVALGGSVEFEKPGVDGRGVWELG